MPNSFILKHLLEQRDEIEPKSVVKKYMTTTPTEKTATNTTIVRLLFRLIIV